MLAFIKPNTEAFEYLEKKKADNEYERAVKGQLVWLKQSPPALFRPCKVKQSFDVANPRGGVVVYREQNKVHEVVLDENAVVLPMGQDNLKCTAHFSGDRWVDISEPALFHNIRLRFDMGYSFQKVCDNILLFLNSEFDTSVLQLATISDVGDALAGDKAKEALAADPLACEDNLSTVVSRSFQRLVQSDGKASQSIVINGCEGSGKRDVTRFVLLRAIQLSRPKNADWWQKLLAGDLLLQALGGENGYVRWTELQLLFPSGPNSKSGDRKSSKTATKQSSCELLGAVCNAFGLDQSRVTDSALDMFPVFPSLATQHKLKSENYGYLGKRAVEQHSKTKKGTAVAWKDISEAMAVLGLDQRTRQEVETTVLGILELGNIRFADVPEGEDEDDFKAKQLALEKAMGDADRPVLGVRLGDLRNALKIKTLHVKHETFEKERTTKEKYAVRDGLARVIYSFLFDWAIQTVNDNVSRIDDVVQSAAGNPRASLGKALKRVSQGLGLGLDASKGAIGIIGVLENAALIVDKSATLEALYQNYRLERFLNFFAHDIAQRNSHKLSAVKATSEKIESLSPTNDAVLELFMGSVHLKYLRLAQEAEEKRKRPGGDDKGKPKGGVAARYQAQLQKRTSSGKGRGSAAAPSAGGSLGLLQMIEEEINLPGGNDKALSRRIGRKTAVNQSLTGVSPTDFTIAHFGAKVTYTLDGLVDRSRSNLIPKQVLKLLKDRSSIKLVQQVVSFTRDPIGQSGVMGKRELESMLELDTKAIEEAAAAAAAEQPDGEKPAVDAAAAATEFDPAERRSNSEMAKRIFNEMNRAVAILGRTQVEYIISLAANPLQDAKLRLDPQFLIDQIRCVGLSDIISKQLYGSLRGQGISQGDFAHRYRVLGALVPSTGAPSRAGARPPVAPKVQSSKANRKSSTPKPPPKVAALSPRDLCQQMSERGLIRGQWALSEDGASVFVNSKSFFALETARSLLLEAAVTRIQQDSRRWLARQRVARMRKFGGNGEYNASDSEPDE